MGDEVEGRSIEGIGDEAALDVLDAVGRHLGVHDCQPVTVCPVDELRFDTVLAADEPVMPAVVDRSRVIFGHENLPTLIDPAVAGGARLALGGPNRPARRVVLCSHARLTGGGWPSRLADRAGSQSHALQEWRTAARAKASAAPWGSSDAMTPSQSRMYSPSAGSHRAPEGSSVAEP
jgi:hypothetical protein